MWKVIYGTWYEMNHNFGKENCESQEKRLERMERDCAGGNHNLETDNLMKS